jgi:hypothetical protein
MSLTRRYARGTKKESAGDQAADFSCPDYEALPGSKRCRYYLDGGPCSRPDHFMCVEWMRANGELPEVVEPQPIAVPASPKAEPTDLFGRPLPAAPERASRLPAVSVSAPPEVDNPIEQDAPALRGLTTEDIESFKALKVEVCMASERFGEVWLVPAYTGQGRCELTPEHAATICQVLSAFPGSTVTAFEKNPNPKEEESTQ